MSPRRPPAIAVIEVGDRHDEGDSADYDDHSRREKLVNRRANQYTAADRK